MFIEKLAITTQTNKIVREVNFRKGLNLIVGVSDESGSSNNIGKTTLIRCIDFCLDGKLEQLYTDKEFKSSINQDVYGFLLKDQPTFTLTLVDQQTNDRYEISRSVVVHQEKNKIKLEDKIILNNIIIKGDFKTELKRILFNNLEIKPTFRQLIPKFIRKDEQQISNVLRYLHATTSHAEYEKIHLFLFGFSAKHILQQKSELEHKLKGLQNAKTALSSRFTTTDLKQILEITKSELEKLYKSRESFQLDERYEIEEKELKRLQLELIKVERVITDFQLKKTLSTNKLKELCEGVFESDTNTLKLLYEEASIYFESLQKTFEDVVDFHNKMIANESKYLELKITEYNISISEFSKKRDLYSQQYSELMKKLSRTGSLAEYTKLNEEIEKLAEKKGSDEKILEEIIKLEEETTEIESNLLSIKKELNKNLDSFNEKLSIFNSSFSKYSQILYDEKYLLSYDETDDPITFHTRNIDGNQGSGKKQAIISAFDLAYVDFVTELNLVFPNFIAHDKIELIDIEKLKALFDIANEINGQYIVPVIQDKIERILPEYESNVILKLNEKNKFFRI